MCDNGAAEWRSEEVAGICDAPQVFFAFRNVMLNFHTEEQKCEEKLEDGTKS